MLPKRPEAPLLNNKPAWDAWAIHRWLCFPPLTLLLAQAQPSPPPAAQVRSAQTHFSQGLKAYQSGTLEDLQLAKTEWAQALTLWQQLGDRPQEVVTRNFLCLLEENLGDYPASLTCYQALLQLTQTANSARIMALWGIARLKPRP